MIENALAALQAVAIDVRHGVTGSMSPCRCVGYTGSSWGGRCNEEAARAGRHIEVLGTRGTQLQKSMWRTDAEDAHDATGENDR